MTMRTNFWLLLLLCSVVVTTQAQVSQPSSLNIGDPAPPLRLRGWLKGEPVEKFEKGKIYVVEFWATWCGPCRAIMPHLSRLASEYRGRATVLSIDVMENKNMSMDKLKAFVDSMGQRMDYNIAAEDRNLMVLSWLSASGQQGIPTAYVVNQDGKVAWLGYPTRLNEILPKIVNETYDIEEAITKWNFVKRNYDKRLEDLDDSVMNELTRYGVVPETASPYGKKDSLLLKIDEMVRKYPNLKYAPKVAGYTFSTLLKTDPKKAYEYGEILLVTPTYDDPPYKSVIRTIELFSYGLNLSAEIYELAAEAYQVEINLYPATDLVARDYHKMAEWYWRACDGSKAIEAEQKAIESLKSQENFSVTELAAFKSRLQQYINTFSGKVRNSSLYSTLN